MSGWDAAAAALEDPWDAALGRLAYERADRPGLLFTAGQHALWDEWDALTARAQAKYGHLPSVNALQVRGIW